MLLKKIKIIFVVHISCVYYHSIDSIW